MTIESAASSSADDRPAVAPVPPPSAWSRWRPLVLRWHFYAGILVGPFMLVAAVTGLIYAVIPQVDRAVYHHELTVDHVGGQRLPLSQLVAAARAAHPEGTIASITPATAPNDTTRVTLAVSDVPTDYGRTVFVDPYTAQVRGALTTYGEWLPVRAWFDALHRNLHLGAFGRNYSELAASWLWVVAAGGVVLWVAHRRRTNRLQRLLVPDRSGPKRNRTMTWHGAVGMWIVIGLLALSASGLSWSRFAGENIGDLRTALSWTTPSVTTGDTGAHADHGSAAQPATDLSVGNAIDGVYRTASDAGLRGPMIITPSSDTTTAWTVSENKRNAPTQFDSMSIDPLTYKEVDRVDFAQWPFMAKMTSWAIDAHMGILFGVINQIALALLAIGLISVIVRGYLMWWRRRPADRSALPAAPQHGALSGLHPAEATALVIAIASIGWFFPLFGVPLAVFVAIDAVRGVRADRRLRAAQ